VALGALPRDLRFVAHKLLYRGQMMWEG